MSQNFLLIIVRTSTTTLLTTSYSGNLTSTSATFTRSGTSGIYYFEALQVTITVSGIYIFQSGSNMDDFGYLYQTSFNPSIPSSNMFASDDDSGGSWRFRITVSLEAGTTYILVFTTFAAGATGPFSVTGGGPGALSFTRLNVGSGSTIATSTTPITTTVSTGNFTHVLFRLQHDRCVCFCFENKRTFITRVIKQTSENQSRKCNLCNELAGKVRNQITEVHSRETNKCASYFLSDRYLWIWADDLEHSENYP